MSSLSAIHSLVLSAPTPANLAKAKATLASLNLLCPPPDAEPKQMAIARDILEAGAFASLRNKDIPAFDRYVGLLRVFWDDYG